MSQQSDILTPEQVARRKVLTLLIKSRELADGILRDYDAGERPEDPNACVEDLAHGIIKMVDQITPLLHPPPCPWTVEEIESARDEFFGRVSPNQKWQPNSYRVYQLLSYLAARVKEDQ